MPIPCRRRSASKRRFAKSVGRGKAVIRDLILPQLAMGMSEGTIVGWAVAEGTLVERDQPLVSIETEKVTTELPAPSRGYVHMTAKVGDVLAVEKSMGQIADTEDEYRSLVAGGASPSAARFASEPEKGRVVADSEVITRATCGRIRASGLAKVIARQNQLDLTPVVGTGPGGRIVRRDVMEALASRTHVVAEVPQTANALHVPKIGQPNSNSTVSDADRVPSAVAPEAMRDHATSSGRFCL